MKSIIIPTYKHLNDFLKPCCESIIKYTDLSDVEVIVVANGCGNDGTKEYVESLGAPFNLIWVDEGLGYTKATNLGVKESAGDIIILMNNDLLLLPQEKNAWMRYLCEPLKNRVGLTCNLKIWDASVERMFAVFFCAATTRAIWDKVGGLDESWSPGGGEDIEFCLKVEQLGYTIIQVPDEVNTPGGNGINVNHFPSYHPGEGTMMDAEHKAGWEKHIHDVRARLKEKYQLPPGWFYGGDIEEYRRLVEDLPEGSTMCELGCYKGRSLCSVSDIIKRKNITVFVVDVFTGTASEGHYEPDYQAEFERNLERFGIRDNVLQILKMTTNEAVSHFGNEAFDLVFIDADHQYSAIKQDIENWLPKVKKHGTISGHDYGTHDGIAKAVNEKWSNVRVGQYIWSKRI